MKKMLVFKRDGIQERQDLDDYLYDSEVTRSDFIDMTPVDNHEYIVGGIAINDSTWDIVFKGDDTYDFWHLIVDSEDSYNFTEPCHLAAINLFTSYNQSCFNLRSVVHNKGMYALVYRIPKVISELFNRHLKSILESFDGKTYIFSIPQDVLGPIVLSASKEEDG